MMLIRRALLSVKGAHLGGILLLTAISVLCLAFSLTGNDDFDLARREILLRRIGHEMLLQSGDSTSRVLPVKKTADNEYQISFEKAFTFQPEVLVSTTQRLLAKDPLASEYVVKVLNCADANVAYGYAIAKNKKDDIVACIGRRQPTACYIINIKFGPTGLIAAKAVYFLAALLLLGFAGFFLFRTVQPQADVHKDESATTGEQPEETQTQSNDLFTLGSMSFDADRRQLITNGNTVDLTRTEARVLHIFAASPNEPIERSRLQKEIWEDEGVIVGRSLDMFISKLRKKLEADPTVKIVVIRGKGYKLEIGG